MGRASIRGAAEAERRADMNRGDDDSRGEVGGAISTARGCASESRLEMSPCDCAPVKGGCIHQIFARRVAETPERIAVECNGVRLTYRELDARANQLAHWLRRKGVGPEVLVGLCLERGPGLVIGILGILKAGGAYVPLDLAYPKDRMAFMLADARTPIVLAQDHFVDALSGHDSQVVCLDRGWTEIGEEPSTPPEVPVSPGHLAYVIYTSGSTGKPKGSLITHANVVSLFEATEPWFHFDQRDVWTLFHSCAFDFSVWEIWGALFYGGRLVVVPFGVTRSPEEFYRLLGDAGVTVLNQTPSAFRQLIRAEEALGQNPKLALRLVVFGGEAMDMKTLKPWIDRHGDQRPRLVNMYGITETTVHVTYRPLSAADLSSGSVIGVPIPGVQVHLLDECQQPVPAGTAGEIYVGGSGVGRGYLDRPELTRERFIAHPFDDRPGARLYRSGDLGRYLPNGDLEYLGRIDQQVKIRGFRVELGEIEAVLNQHPAVRETVVLARDDPAGQKRLVAYIIRRSAADVGPVELRQTLRERLPEYMVPAAFVFIERLPLTTNGKLDVPALPNPDDVSQREVTRPSASGTGLEKAIGALWEEVLGRPLTGLDDNFFDVGGTSISLAEVHARLQRLVGREFPITDLFARPTIRSLAAHLDQQPASGRASNAVQDRARRQRQVLADRRSGTTQRG